MGATLGHAERAQRTSVSLPTTRDMTNLRHQKAADKARLTTDSRRTHTQPQSSPSLHSNQERLAPTSPSQCIIPILGTWSSAAWTSSALSSTIREHSSGEDSPKPAAPISPAPGESPPISIPVGILSELMTAYTAAAAAAV